MHTLYAFPFACSQAVHAVLRAQGIEPELRWVPRGPARKVADADLATVNPKRKVPTLVLPDGTVLTEIVSVLHALDAPTDRTPSERRAHLEWLAFLATELHQQVLGPLFDPDTPQETLPDLKQRLLPPVLAHLEATVHEHGTLLGTDPSPADHYLVWGLLLLGIRWPEMVATPGLQAFRARMLEQPALQQTLAIERARSRDG